MNTPRWTLRAAAILAALAVGATGLSAQGTTTGSIAGTVATEQGQPVDAAQVQVVNRSTGFTAGVLTNANGRFNVSGLELGSRYAVTIRRIGYQPQTRENVIVNLGQTVRVDFTLSTQPTVLAGVQVVAEQTPVISPSHTGVVTQVSDSALRRLPTLNRNFTDFVALTPQVSTTLFNGGLSGGGTNNRYNNVQIDGTTEADLFGLGSTGQPGGQANGKSIGLESVKEYQILLSPFDVRQGFFAGLTINAVSKSGTNDFHGSAFYQNRNAGNTRSQPYISQYLQEQYGASIGGPIIKDRAFFFFSPEFQRRTSPAFGPYLGQPGFTTLDTATTTAFINALQANGITPQGTFGLINNENPLSNIFTRFDINLPFNSQLVLRHNYAHSENDVFSRGTSTGSPFSFSDNGYFFQSTKQAPALQLRTLFGNGAFNELLIGLNSIRDRRTPRAHSPEITVLRGSNALRQGAERFSHGNELDQDIAEITENFTMPFGSAHRITIGTQNQLYKFRNLFAQSIFGVWQFNSIDSLSGACATCAGTPRASQYIVGVPLQSDGAGGVQVGGDGAVRGKAALYSGYLQDEWTVSPTLNVSLGLRADMSVFIDKPPTNAAFLAAYGRNTADVSSGNIQWSPRVGFNWDVTGDAVNQLRGGVGLFTGRPAYVWLANAFQNSGMGGNAVLTCNGAAAVPAFNPTNINTPPTQCANGNSAALGAEIDLMDPNLKFPQNLRGTVGYDRRLAGNWIATAEVLYTLGVNGLFYYNAALPDTAQGINTHEGRYIYGAPNNPVLRAQAAGPCPATAGCRSQIFDIRNQSKDHAYSLTGGVKRNYANNYEASVYYTYTRAWDVQSFTSSTAFSQYRFGRVWGGDLMDQTATRSSFDQRHRIVATGTYTFPTHTTLSVTYFGESGAPFTYIASGDLNGDGITLNDPVYIPTNAMDTTQMHFNPTTFVTGGPVVSAGQQAAAFENYIRSTSCLRENRGKLMTRNSCTGPFTNTMNVSFRQTFNTLRLQNVSLEANVFNFLNLINKSWGVQPSPGTSPITLLGGTSYVNGTNLTGQPNYTFNPNYTKYFTNNLASNYQIQFFVRYDF